MKIIECIKHADSSVRLSSGAIAPKNEIAVEKHWNGNQAKVKIINKSNKSFYIKEVILFAGEMPVDGETEFYGEGFNMLCQYTGSLSNPKVIGAYGTDGDFFRLPRTEFDRELWTVYNLLFLSPANDKNHVLMAYTSCNRFSGEFRFKNNYIEAVMDTEDLQLRQGDTWEMEEFLILTGEDRNELFAKLAEQINVNHPRRMYHEIPTGWCSYYCLRPMTAEGLFENAYQLAGRIPELKRIQVDGGYEAHNGDWLIPHPRLGTDLKTIFDGIRKMGAEPGGYLSPFIVDIESNLYKEHPDWLVCDEQGHPFNEIGHKREWYMLDGSNPEVQEYFRKIARIMYDEWGLRYIKLDFLSYGALPGGQRYDKNATRVEAFRMGIKAIVDEVGEDCYILGCNAPFWPLLGLVHGNRATNDIFRAWKQVSGNARELFWRNWQNNTLWWNDPDCILLEKLDLYGIKNGEAILKKSLLTDHEFEFHKAFIVASGGVVFSGDLIGRMAEQNINVLKRLIPSTGVAARFDDTTFTIGRINLKDRNILCIFNWDDCPKDIEIDLAGAFRIYDFWTDEEMGVYKDKIVLEELENHSAKVLVCKALPI